MAETEKPGRTGRDDGAALQPAARRRRWLGERLSHHLRSWRWRGALIAVGLVGAGTVALLWRTPPLDCDTAAGRGATDAIIVSMCEREFADSQDPADGIRLADAHRRAGKLDVATSIANSLLAVPSTRADAYQILGKIALKQSRLDEATEALERARNLHGDENRPGDVAKDDQALAGILTRRQQYPEALRTLHECIELSHTANDKTIEGYCRLSAAQVLWRVGYFSASEQELSRAAPLVTTPRDHAWFQAQRGNLEQDRTYGPVPSDHKLAVHAFEQTLDYAARAQLPDLSLTTHLNLAYSLAEDDQLDEAERNLDAAQNLDRSNAYASQRAQLTARIAFRRGNLKLAASLNDAQYDKIEDNDERIDVCAMQARIALATNDLALAETWARRGIEHAEKVVGRQNVLELRPWVSSRRRAPHELLFTALARAGRFEAALAAFDHWQGHGLLGEISRPPSALLELRGAATQLDKLGAWFPQASTAPLMRTDNDAPIPSLHSIDVLVLILADGRLWHVSASRGVQRMMDLGLYKDLKERLLRFKSNPIDHAIADEVGALLLRDDIGRETQDTLRVVLDSPLSSLPIAALRRNGRPLIAARPIVHALRMTQLSCVPAAERRRATVLADPQGNLPAARREAATIAGQLGTAEATGAQATSAVLFHATDSDILHVATHADVANGGGVLPLHDEKVSALEIAARRIGPSLVVLSACSSAQASAEDLGGALSTAFLASGSLQVVATLRPISDTGAAELTTRFYTEGGAKDPARALARIQASLVDTPNADWARFAVFGRDVCPSP
jgi:tetratricopeptide (TPR) repeat protein